jgi:calcineurin-like phosphoesterase family protein
MKEPYYIADLHLSHGRNMLFSDNSVDQWKLDGYPDLKKFNNIDNDTWSEFVVKQWNNTITNEDLVYIAGDVGLNTSSNVIKYLEQLKGDKILIEGNHDKKLLKDPAFKRCFKSINDCNLAYNEKLVYEDGSCDSREIWLSMTHYPILAHQGHTRYSVNICGHIHSTYHIQKALDLMNNYLIENGIPHREINVGITCPWMDFKPKILQDIMRLQDYYASRCKEYTCSRIR